MEAKEIKNNVFYVGAIDWDRKLFDELIPTPQGTSYNAYLIKGKEKTALIDTVDFHKLDELLLQLKSLCVEKIDYVVINHAEQDHSGNLPKILAQYPMAKVLTNAKCKDLLESMLLIPAEKIEVVADGAEISLGDKTLKFILTPWVHWPDTMCTYLVEDKILFSMDFFGAHLATSDLWAKNDQALYDGAKRYYAEIMMPFRSQVQANIKKVEALGFQILCPSHGPIYAKPEFIINAYKDWSSDKVKPEVVIPWVSMHGSTKAIVDYLVEALIKKGLKVKPYNITQTDVGDLAMELVDASTIVLAGGQTLAGAHPKLAYIAFLANILRPKTKFVSIVGSWGWGGKMLEQLQGLIPNLKVEIIEPVMVKGYPKQEDYARLDKLATEIAEKNS